jgi:hypothetical protein
VNEKLFEEIVKEQLGLCEAMLVRKGVEYATEVDRLYNFKRAAEMLGEGATPLDALLGMWSKHMVSVMDMLSGAILGEKLPKPEYINEKFTDFINYALLAKALMLEMGGIGKPVVELIGTTSFSAA